MASEFKTLSFPNTPRGQLRKNRQLMEHVSNGWEIVSETITPGKFKGKTACCLALVFLPCGFCAGTTDGEIMVTLRRN